MTIGILGMVRHIECVVENEHVNEHVRTRSCRTPHHEPSRQQPAVPLMLHSDCVLRHGRAFLGSLLLFDTLQGCY